MSVVTPQRRAFLVVRSVVSDPRLHDEFDHWYATDHTPLALRLLGAVEAWRCWSDTDSSVHYAFYAFSSLEAAQNGLASPHIPRLLAEYDARWPQHVVRTREVIVEHHHALRSA